MKNGYTMPYFPLEAGHIVFSKALGVIPSAQRLDIKKIIKAVPPDQVDDGISHGTRQAFAVFALPGSPNSLRHRHRRHRRQPGRILLRRPLLLRRSAHHLRQLAQKRLGRHRRAPGHPRHERTPNPHVHRPRINRSTVPAKATAPSPTIRQARMDHHLRQQPRHRSIQKSGTNHGPERLRSE